MLTPRLAALALLPVFLFAQSNPARLDLQVRDPLGAPLAASGLLESTTTSFRLAFSTSSSGTASLPNLTPGPYRLRLSRDGFVSHDELLTLTPAQTLTRNLTLPLGPSSYTISVVSATPLAGLDRPLDEIPAPVQTLTSQDFTATNAPDLSSLLNLRFNNVYLNEVQGNPFQPDLNYRGFTASPLLGTPQGLSIYFDGVRLNQPFGDVVSWDLIPRVAISEAALIPGSNPLFGLNTLGGSVSLRTKDGLSHPGALLQLQGGSFGRRMADLEHGGSAANGLNWFLASSFFFEDGWRDSSPSNVRQLFGKLGSQRQRTGLHLSFGFANNSLIGNGLQDNRLLAADYRSVYTKPDLTANRSPFWNFNFRRSLSPAWSLSSNLYYRSIRTRTFNGDINEESLRENLYQPNAAERAALAAAGFTGFPSAGENAANTPFPRWRCIANALLADEPAEKCNGLLNSTASQQHNYGFSAQLTRFHAGPRFRNQFTLGGAWDANRVSFLQSSELGYINPDRSISGVGVFGDGVTGGEIDGEPYDTRVNLRGRIHSSSLFLTDTLTLANRLALTLSGRFNRTTVDNFDRIRPLPGTGSLTGLHTFQRFNPALGLTYRLNSALHLYGSYTEGNRAPTSIELGCADPDAPCRLPNAMAGDPPLNQVRTRTWEFGLRSPSENRLQWSANWFQATNRDDILFVASERTGFGYFQNFAQTRRRGLELDSRLRLGRVLLTGGYTFLDATFQSREEVNGAGNSTNEEALAGIPGLEGTIEIEPGNRIPLTPRHVLKASSTIQATSRLSLQVNVFGASSAFARGNENNLHAPDGQTYFGPGSSPGYGVANLGAIYRLTPRLQFFAQVNNLFNRRFYTAAQLGSTGFTPAGDFVARPLPPVDGEYPLPGVTFLAPGAPRGAWAGLRLRF
jgi:outer membrane receptor protein involved in Fe transport